MENSYNVLRTAVIIATSRYPEVVFSVGNSKGLLTFSGYLKSNEGKNPRIYRKYFDEEYFEGDPALMLDMAMEELTVFVQRVQS